MTEPFVSAFPGACDLGQSLFKLAQGCYAYEAVVMVANDPQTTVVVPDAPVGQGPQGRLKRKDGSFHTFDVRHYLNLSNDPAATQNEIMQSWCAGAIITAGDLLSDDIYKCVQPEFELIYHLRNGVAHGNKFHIRDAGKKRLSKQDAYLRRHDGSERFHISESLMGQAVLFDFLGAGDVADLLILTAERLRDSPKP